MNKLLAAGVALALVMGGLSLSRSEPVSPVEQGPVVGAVSSPDIQSNWLRVGGVMRYFYHKDFAGTSTSTPCAFQVVSTSTLAFASLRIGTASSTATTWTVAKATSPYATTTILTNFPQLASGAQGTMVASTTPYASVAGDEMPAIDVKTVFGPGQWLVWSVAGLTHTAYDPALLGGQCDAMFVQV